MALKKLSSELYKVRDDVENFAVMFEELSSDASMKAQDMEESLEDERANRKSR